MALKAKHGLSFGQISPVNDVMQKKDVDLELSNRVRIYLAKDVRKTAAARPDAGEDIEVVLLERREVPARIAGGEINNAMTVAALALASFGGHL